MNLVIINALTELPNLQVSLPPAEIFTPPAAHGEPQSTRAASATDWRLFRQNV